MGMGKKQKLNVRRFHRPSGYGQRSVCPLRYTAINQDIQFTGLKKMAGTRNTFFSPKMGNLKNIDSLSYCHVFFATIIDFIFRPAE
jgi:hypothetical protein